MRSKEEIMKEIGAEMIVSSNEYLFLEVLTDIRDQLSGINKAPKLEAQIDALHKAMIPSLTKKDAKKFKVV